MLLPLILFAHLALAQAPQFSDDSHSGRMFSFTLGARGIPSVQVLEPRPGDGYFHTNAPLPSGQIRVQTIFSDDLFWSRDGITYQKLDETLKDSEGRLYSLPAHEGSNYFRVGPSPPHDEAAYYTYEQYLDHMTSLDPGRFLMKRVIGKSVQGRPIYGLGITDRQVRGPKKTLWIQARQHGDEYSHSYIVESLVDHLVDPSPPNEVFRQLRETFFIGIVPMMNPDGAVARSRYNAHGVDLNRTWHESGNYGEEEPEVSAVHATLDRWISRPSQTVIFAYDHHNTYEGDWGYRFDRSTVPQQYFENQDRFVELLTSHDPFQRRSDWQENPGTPGMARVALYLQHSLDILTIETANAFRNNGSQVREEDLREEAIHFANALWAYIGEI